MVLAVSLNNARHAAPGAQRVLAPVTYQYSAVLPVKARQLPGNQLGPTAFSDVLASWFSSARDFLRDLWGKLFGTAQAAVELDADSAAIARENHLLPTRQNVEAFLLEMRRYEQDGTLGPGSPDSEAIRQIQQTLASWGYAVVPNGSYDPATTAVMVLFKQQHGLRQSYRLADGSWEVNGYLDNQTFTKLREYIGKGTRPPAWGL